MKFFLTLLLLCAISASEDLSKEKNQPPLTVLDEMGTKLNDFKQYNKFIDSIHSDKSEASKLLLRIWEIRSWVHLTGQPFNESETDWSHHTHEPLMGITTPEFNPLFDWARKNKPKIDKNSEFSSYFFENDTYKILKRLKQGSYFGNFYFDDGVNVSSGLILENTTDNQDGPAGKVLYICFRETTGPLQIAHWVSTMAAWERPFHYHFPEGIENKIPPELSIGRGIWGAYSSMSGKDPKTYSNASIRKSLIEFIKDNGAKYEKIIISGMSLGGAISQCAAIDIRNILNIKIPIHLFLYASPRVGDKELLKYYNTNNVLSVRIEANKKDSVVGFPYSSGLLKGSMIWKHAGFPIRLDIHESDMITDLKFPKNSETYGVEIPNNKLSIVGSRLPKSLIYGAKSIHNFHTRPNYTKFLYFYCLKQNIELPKLFRQRKN